MGKSEALSGHMESSLVTEEGGDMQEIYLQGWRKFTRFNASQNARTMEREVGSGAGIQELRWRGR